MKLTTLVLSFIAMLAIIVYFAPPPEPPPASALQLTLEEIQYISDTAILVATEQNYHPFIVNDGVSAPRGISVDYLNLISKKTGLKVILDVFPCQLEDCLNSVKAGDADLVTSVRPTPSRSEFLMFSRPYYVVDTVMIKAVKDPKEVAIGKGYAVGEYLKINYPSLKIVEFSSDEQSLLAMLSNQIDAVVMDSLSASELRKKYKHNFDEQIIPHVYPLSFAVDKNNRILASILDKAISSITESEKSEIAAKWN